MANTWKPKYRVTCTECGWTGIRAFTAKRCPKCKFWHPRKNEHLHHHHCECGWSGYVEASDYLLKGRDTVRCRKCGKYTHVDLAATV